MLSFLKGLKRKIIFEDGSAVEWCDRETVKYTKHDRFCLAWVDYYENYFFSGDRLIHSGSIKQWKLKGGEVLDVTEEERKEILKKILDFYYLRGIKAQVET